MKTTRRVLVFASAMVLLAGTVGCSNSDQKADGDRTSTVATSSTTTAAPADLKILVSNDDGYAAPGIDALVSALTAMPHTEVQVSAPATQQSGKGGSTTEGELSATEAKTLSGHPVIAVAGTPADSINWALDGGIDFKPDLVVTGINAGQNLGGLADQVSGTVGAARAAVAHGIPAFATSMGLGDDADFAMAARFVVDWVNEHRADLLAGNLGGDTPLLENLNVPYCTSGEPRGLVDTTMAATTDHAFDAQDCGSTAPPAEDDITAFNDGFVTLSPLPAVKG